MRRQTAFVTGATGLLGNNLVRELMARDFNVRALARSPEKARRQFSDLPDVECVFGDMENVAVFADKLNGCDVIFHTAAYFRDSYKGGRHWNNLKRINVDGTAELLECAFQQGVRKFVHTSSIAVLRGAPGSLIDESCDRDIAEADDYYRSKMLSDDVVRVFLEKHPEMHASFVLPGWMWGPRDIGPTSSGQVVVDTLRGKLPGLVPGSFSVVDTRDVALALIAAAERGRRGERYLAAGRNVTMKELIPLIGKIGQVATPTRQLSLPLLYAFAVAQEIYARITRRPILLSFATVKLMTNEAGRTHFSSAKSESELGLTFRPLEDTVLDTVRWYRQNGWLTVAS